MMGKWEEAREALRASQMEGLAEELAGAPVLRQWEPLKVCEKGSDLLSHLSGE